MVELFQRTIRKIKFFYSFIKSLILGNLLKKQYRSIKTFVMFVGYPRSGHSLIAALLDAHPNIVMGMEWGVIPHLKMGYNQLQIFYSIIHNAKRFRNKENNVWTGYSYKVNNWQGNFDEIHVIGDKFGGRTAIMFSEEPELLSLVQSKINLPFKYIHVIRNPFDTITTMTKRHFETQRGKADPQSIDLLPFIKLYFQRINLVNHLRGEKEIHIHDLYHEDFIAKPQIGLKDLLNFLEVKYDPDYIQDCVKIVYKEPHKSRMDIEWSDDLVHYVEQLISSYNFLRRYNFTN